MNLQSPIQTERSTYFFSPRELARLAVYRAAVVARFYTDQYEPTPVRSERQAPAPTTAGASLA